MIYVFIWSLVVLGAIFYVVVPYHLFWKNGVGFELQRSYFLTLVSYVTLLSSIFGLYLGNYYFKSKNNIEERRIKKDKIENRINYILNELKSLDGKIEKVLFGSVENFDDLSMLRDKITKKAEEILIIIENSEDILNLDSFNIKYFVELWSLLETNENFMHSNFDSYKDSDFETLKDNYRESLKLVKWTCVNSLE